MPKSLSQELCELCGVEAKIIGSVLRYKRNSKGEYVETEDKYGYPDFESPENKIMLQDIFVENDHIVTLEKDWFSISNGAPEFIDDCCGEHTEFTGKTFLQAVYNYLSLWYEQREVRYQLPDGTMGEAQDMSHTLEREECYYPELFDEMLKDIERIKQTIRDTEWNIRR